MSAVNRLTNLCADRSGYFYRGWWSNHRGSPLRGTVGRGWGRTAVRPYEGDGGVDEGRHGGLGQARGPAPTGGGREKVVTPTPPLPMGKGARRAMPLRVVAGQGRHGHGRLPLQRMIKGRAHHDAPLRRRQGRRDRPGYPYDGGAKAHSHAPLHDDERERTQAGFRWTRRVVLKWLQGRDDVRNTLADTPAVA
jgi:hypothetical protein